VYIPYKSKFSYEGEALMKQLKTRQERFCRKFVELGCATTAARAAGYAPQWANSALRKLETVFRRAIVDHHFATAARAVDLQARLRGFTGPGAAAPVC
jgi:hypothetical protein